MSRSRDILESVYSKVKIPLIFLHFFWSCTIRHIMNANNVKQHIFIHNVKKSTSRLKISSFFSDDLILGPGKHLSPFQSSLRFLFVNWYYIMIISDQSNPHDVSPPPTPNYVSDLPLYNNCLPKSFHLSYIPPPHLPHSNDLVISNLMCRGSILIRDMQHFEK